MRILHCCLAAIYSDNYGYQENILPKMHKLHGHDVAIMASTETYATNTSIGYVKPATYRNEDNIQITRLPYSNFLPHLVMTKLRLYVGVLQTIESFKPDIIFIHDFQFLSVINIISYLKKNPKVLVYVDGHTDFINSAKTPISKYFLHGIIYKWCAKRIEPYTTKFYGVLPLRNDFLVNFYKLPKSKVDLLPLGIDDSVVEFSKKRIIRKLTREKLKINSNDFVLITGGKIDYRKNIHRLLKAVTEINNDKIKLILFGAPDEQMKNTIQSLSDHKCIRNIGWIASYKVYDYFFAADLAVFPGTHSVLWEQAVGSGTPCLFKKWEGIQHVDVGGNCLFIETCEVNELKKNILAIYNNRTLVKTLKKEASEKGQKFFSYYEIAKRAIQQ